MTKMNKKVLTLLGYEVMPSEDSGGGFDLFQPVSLPGCPIINDYHIATEAEAWEAGPRYDKDLNLAWSLLLRMSGGLRLRFWRGHYDLQNRLYCTTTSETASEEAAFWICAAFLLAQDFRPGEVELDFDSETST